jgi:hypothetical protein
MGFDQRHQGLPCEHRFNYGQKLLPFGLLFGGGLLVIREAELLAAHQPSPGLRLQGHSPAVGPGFPGSP